MSAKEGNKYWENRKKHGRSKAIRTPKALWGHACDYFQRCDDNPWIRVDFKGKDVDRVEIPTSVPYTWDGLENYLFEINVISKLDDYKSNRDGRYNDFVDIITRIDKIIRDRKMTGAIVGVYNSNIIARDLGLAEKREVETDDKKPKTPEEKAARIKELTEKLLKGDK